MNTATQHPTSDFIAAIAPDAGYMEVRALSRKGESPVQFWIRPESFADPLTIGKLSKLNAAGRDLYVGVNARPNRGDTGDKCIQSARVVFIDADQDAKVDDVLGKIETQGLPRPSIVIASGHGVHCYWMLSAEITPETFTAIQLDLAHTLGTDTVVNNPERIMRLPGFKNWKPPVADCVMIECDPSRVYDLDEITDRLIQHDDKPEIPPPPTMAELDALASEHTASAKASYNGQSSVIDQWDDAHDIGQMLRANGYTPTGKPDHYWRPGKSEGMHSVIVRGNRSFHFSSNDPLNNRRFGRGSVGVNSPFDITRETDMKGSDLKTCVRTAAEVLGVSHRQQAEKNGTAGHIESNEVTTTPPEPLDDHTPFPVDELPAVMRDFVTEGAKANQIAPDFIAPPLISALGAAIGNRAVALLKTGFVVPPNIWTAVVAASGEGKSPAFRSVLAPVYKRQGQLVQRYNEACDEYQKMLAEWEAKPKDERGTKPQHPTMEHNIVSDATTEALAVRLMASPAGLLAAVDELAGNFKGYNAYKKGGNDREAWLGFYDAGYVKIDRKTAAVATIIVKRAFVSLTGGIQPGVLAGVMNDDDFDAGLAARFLFTLPPTQRKTWSEDIIDPAILEAMGATFESLYSLPFNTGEDGIEPAVLPLTSDAKSVWGRWFGEVEDELRSFVDTETAYATALPKVRTAAARLALVFQLVSYVTNDNNAKGNHVDAFNMGRAVNVMRWFKNEQKRVYASLHMTKAHRRLLKIVDTIRSDFGGSVSVRDWQRRRGLKTSEQAATELETVIAASMGEWTYDQHPNGGKPVKRITIK